MCVKLTYIVAYPDQTLGWEGVGVGKEFAGIGVVGERQLLRPRPDVPSNKMQLVFT